MKMSSRLIITLSPAVTMSRFTAELEVVDCVLQMFDQSSSVNVILASFSHLVLTHIMDSLLFSCKVE